MRREEQETSAAMELRGRMDAKEEEDVGRRRTAAAAAAAAYPAATAYPAASSVVVWYIPDLPFQA